MNTLEECMAELKKANELLAVEVARLQGCGYPIRVLYYSESTLDDTLELEGLEYGINEASLSRVPDALARYRRKVLDRAELVCQLVNALNQVE